jgi:hypothetical protein
MDDGGSNLRIGDVRASPRPIEPVAVEWRAPVEAPRVSWGTPEPHLDLFVSNNDMSLAAVVGAEVPPAPQ